MLDENHLGLLQILGRGNEKIMSWLPAAAPYQ